MRKITLVLLVVLVLFMGWILYSSMVQTDLPTYGSSPYHGLQNGLGSGGPGGAGSGSGSSTGIGSIGIPTSGVSFPTIGNFFSFHLPHLNVNLSFLAFWIYFPHFSHHFGGSSINITHPVQRNTTTQSGGGGGGSGNTYRIPLPLNIYLFIFVGIVVIVFVIVITQVLSIRKKDQRKHDVQEEEAPVPEFPPLNRSAIKEETERKITFTEDTEIMRPWKEEKTLLEFGIDGDLPLIWDSENSLSITSPSNITVVSSNSESKLYEGPKLDIMLTERCTGFISSKADYEDFKVVRSVDYEQETVDLFRLNFLYNIDGRTSLTPSEVIGKVMDSDPSCDRLALRSVLQHFERSLYGKRKMSRQEFQDYIRMLMRGRPKALGFVCRRNSDEQSR
ncbi:MAG: hypothetical protein ACP5NK_02070 [Thermoplasmata archaeon]